MVTDENGGAATGKDGKLALKDRIKRAVAAMDAAGVDGLLLCPGADLFYLSGFEHSHAGERLLALLLRRDGSNCWIVPTMNREQVEAHALRSQTIIAWTDSETYRPALSAALQGLKSLAFDDEARAAFLLDAIDADSNLRIVRSSSVMRGLRIRKTNEEIAALRRAGETVDQAIPEATALCRAGMQESEVEDALRAVLLRLSPESSIGFSIVASGLNSALPHHETGRRVLRRGDVVVLDYGTRLAGYYSDITVSCSIGEPADSDVRKVYRVVWEAQQRALEAVRPGIVCAEIDRAARDVISEAGYGLQFLHRTGHGLGLQIHEPPYMVSGNDERLEEGMVFSVEPGIYLAGRFGIRLEVIASVTADGVSLINAPSAPQLPISPG
ncbi:MAG TPA: Xaa-Pro peptidase family protein [Armatimonadota bacterium]|nr:Xaa-Pro peptidase family protein [Armatimonadota bacterium]